jgi:hypothetical protein
MTLGVIVTVLTEIITLLGLIVGFINDRRKTMDGMRCLLRSEMLRIYYHHREKGEIRQYEYENFVFLYEAYKKLKGNSFIDKIYNEVKTWEVIS